MKEDYLWDKTGEDREIERLEHALQALRYQETAAPALPQKVFAPEPPPRKAFFRFGFAFAACAAIVVIFSLVWLRAPESRTQPGAVADAAPANDFKRAENGTNDVIAPRDIETPSGVPEKRKRFAASKIEQTYQIKARRSKLPASGKKVQAPAETLTKEEQYAYDQLMLALTITGSKLKIVQDKISGIDEQNAVVEK